MHCMRSHPIYNHSPRPCSSGAAAPCARRRRAPPCGAGKRHGPQGPQDDDEDRFFVNDAAAAQLRKIMKAKGRSAIVDDKGFGVVALEDVDRLEKEATAEKAAAREARGGESRRGGRGGRDGSSAGGRGRGSSVRDGGRDGGRGTSSTRGGRTGVPTSRSSSFGGRGGGSRYQDAGESDHARAASDDRQSDRQAAAYQPRRRQPLFGEPDMRSRRERRGYEPPIRSRGEGRAHDRDDDESDWHAGGAEEEEAGGTGFSGVPERTGSDRLRIARRNSGANGARSGGYGKFNVDNSDSDEDGYPRRGRNEYDGEEEQMSGYSRERPSAGRGRAVRFADLPPPLLPRGGGSAAAATRAAPPAPVDIPVVRRERLPEKGTFFSGASWAELGASEEVAATLKAMGVTRPSHVQVRCWF
jgi:hypothetical protein